jgi:hypothetical protein
MTKVTAPFKHFSIPVVGEFNLRLAVTWRSQENQGETARGYFLGSKNFQPQRVTVKLQGIFEVGNPNHGV